MGKEIYLVAQLLEFFFFAVVFRSHPIDDSPWNS